MTRDGVLSTLKILIADVCGIQATAINDDGKLIAYGLDSVRALDLLLGVEDELGVSISEHDPALRSVETVRQLAELVEQRRSG